MRGHPSREKTASERTEPLPGPVGEAHIRKADYKEGLGPSAPSRPRGAPVARYQHQGVYSCSGVQHVMTGLYWTAAVLALVWAGYTAVRLRRDRSALVAASLLCMSSAAATMCVALVVRNVGGRVTPEVVNDVAFIGEIADVLPTARSSRSRSSTTRSAEAVPRHATFRRRYAERIGADETTLREHAILDPAATVKRDIERLHTARAIPSAWPVRHVYDVVTGLVETVLPPTAQQLEPLNKPNPHKETKHHDNHRYSRDQARPPREPRVADPCPDLHDTTREDRGDGFDQTKGSISASTRTTTPPRDASSDPTPTTTPPRDASSDPTPTTTPPRDASSDPTPTTTPPRDASSDPTPTTTPPRDANSDPTPTTTPRQLARERGSRQMLDNLVMFLDAHGRRVLLVAVIGAAIASEQSIHTQERTT